MLDVLLTNQAHLPRSASVSDSLGCSHLSIVESGILPGALKVSTEAKISDF